eukprot:350412-Chlamydomonas_euryale.AAC.3
MQPAEPASRMLKAERVGLQMLQVARAVLPGELQAVRAEGERALLQLLFDGRNVCAPTSIIPNSNYRHFSFEGVSTERFAIPSGQNTWMSGWMDGWMDGWMAANMQTERRRTSRQCCAWNAACSASRAARSACKFMVSFN